MSGLISCQTATDIALSYREIERAEELLRKVENDLANRKVPDLRDAFGRPAGHLQLGVPTSESGRTLYQVPWELCAPILKAHIALHRQKLATLCIAARVEMDASEQGAGA